jgi:ligand-binding sensor domain-containing protein
MNKLKIKYIIIFLIFLILLNKYAFSQFSNWTNYSFANTIYSIAEEDSLLWIGTDVGLFSYNKYTCEKKSFDQSNSIISGNNEILQIVVDKYHNKWLATYNGLIRHKNNEWELIDKIKLGSRSNMINHLRLENDSILWFCTKENLYKYFNNSITKFKLNDTLFKYNEIKCFEIDSFGNKWLGTSRNGILKISKDTFQIYNFQNTKLPDDEIDCMHMDKQGKLWIGTSSGLCVYYLNKWKIYKRFRYRNRNRFIIPSTNIENIIEDNQGNIWLFTFESGIRKFSHGKFYRYNYWNTNRLEINYPKCGILDSENNLWFGMHNFGGFLFKYNQKSWQQVLYANFPTKDGWLSMNFLQLDNEDNLWTGTGETNSAMLKFNGEEWKAFNGRDIGNYEYTVYIHELATDSKGNRWFTSNYGLFKNNGENWELFKDNEIIKGKKNWYQFYYNSITIDNNDNIWIGTFNRGLLKFDGFTWKSYSTKNSIIPSNKISDLAIDNNNNIWIGTDRGLAKIDVNSSFTIYDNTNSMFPECIISKLIFDSSNNLLIGTQENGVIKFDGHNFSFLVKLSNQSNDIKFCETNYLKNVKRKYDISPYYIGILNITDIAIEDSTTIWIGTKNSGLCKINNSNYYTFNSSNSGLLTNYISSIAIDHKGNKWIGIYRKGFSKFK